MPTSLEEGKGIRQRFTELLSIGFVCVWWGVEVGEANLCGDGKHSSEWDR